MTTLTELLNDPEVHYPGNFDTPQRAVALLTGLCQDAAIEIERLNKAVAAEREACAKVCEEIGEESDSFTRDILRSTAAAIRARGTHD